MCIIAGPVKSVSSTRIFVAPSTQGDRQLTVYSNTVQTDARNLMILPVPNPQTVQFEPKAMQYKNLFQDAKYSFHTRMLESATLSMTRSAPHSTLDVIDVGSYKASIAYSVDDLLRLNAGVFGDLNPKLLDMLRSTYGDRFGFVCCILNEGGNTYEPIAYSHVRGSAHSLFVPTKHYHVHNINPLIEYSYANESIRNFYEGALHAATKWSDDWDHEIYSIGTTAASAHKQGHTDYIPKEKNEIDWSQFSSGYKWGPNHRLHRWCMQGEFHNVDLEFTVALAH